MCYPYHCRISLSLPRNMWLEHLISMTILWNVDVVSSSAFVRQMGECLIAQHRRRCPFLHSSKRFISLFSTIILILCWANVFTPCPMFILRVQNVVRMFSNSCSTSYMAFNGPMWRSYLQQCSEKRSWMVFMRVFNGVYRKQHSISVSIFVCIQILFVASRTPWPFSRHNFFAIHSFYHSLRKGRLKQTHAQNYNDQTDRTFGRNAHWHVLAFCGHITAFLLLHNSKRSIIICDAIVKFVVILIHQSPCNAGSMTPNGIYNYPTHTKC